MNTLIYILLFGTALCGGLVFLLFKKTSPTFLKLSLSFSGAFLFSITVLHLIPEAYETESSTTGIFILAGFLLQILIEFFSEGIEHGHIHVHKDSHGAFPLAVMLGLCMHSFFEGMPVSMQSNEMVRNSLISGIILHHMPVAFALMSLLISSGLNIKNSILYLLLFALMTPAGALLAEKISLTSVTSETFFHQMTGLVIGIFLHTSTTILFESGDEHRFNLYKILTILAGVGLALLNL